MTKNKTSAGPKSRRTVHIHDRDWKRLDEHAEAMDVSAATLVRQFIKLGLRELDLRYAR